MEQPEQNIAANPQLTETADPPLPRRRPSRRQPEPPAGAGARRVVFDVENVSIWYSAFKAVTDVSMTVHEHEITAFIGPSGCGKTTVLRAFNRMNDLVPGARVEGDDALPRRPAVRQGCLPDRRAPAHRHGLPEAEPVPEVDLRQRRLRAAHQRRAQQAQAGRDRRALAAPGRAVGRGEGPPEDVGPEPVRRAGAAAVHRPHDRRRAGRRPHGRALPRRSTRSRPAPSRT